METLNYTCTYTCTHTLLTSPKGAFIFNYPHDIWLSFRRRVVITSTGLPILLAVQATDCNDYLIK